VAMGMGHAEDRHGHHGRRIGHGHHGNREMSTGMAMGVTMGMGTGRSRVVQTLRHRCGSE